MGSLLTPFSMAAVNVAIPSIAASLNADAVLIALLPTAFLLSNVSMMLPAAKLADNLGRKRIYAIGLAVNATGAIGSFLSPSIEWILFFRFIQGAGSAMVMGTSMALITSVYKAGNRGLALGLNTACIYIGLTVAPAIGGYITDNYGWKMVLFIPAPLACFLILALLTCIKTDWKRSTHSPFDWYGAITFALWAFSLVMGISGLPKLGNIVWLLFSFTTLGLFLWHQSRTSEPLIKLKLFKQSRTFSMSLGTAMLMYASNYPIGFLLSLYLQYIKGIEAFQAGQIMLTQALGMALLAPFSGKLSDYIEPRILSTIGCLIVASGFMFLSQMDIDTSTKSISTSLFCIGIGFGLFSSPNTNAILSTVDVNDNGVASATINLARVSGNLVGISLVNLLVQLMIGGQQINTDNYPQLLATLNWALSISCCFVIIASILSASRGRTILSPHPKTSEQTS